MDAKHRQSKKPGLDDNWRGMKVNPLYNTSALIKAVSDKIKGPLSGKRPK